jgi:exonuclease SbcC
VIPVHLKLSGFLSYREPAEVDFTTFHLACISGANGAGKSSLLDAITWALFGQARKRDESLVNLQSKSAEVAFTFAYEGNLYRVLRQLARGKTGTLEFQVATGGEAEVPLARQALTWRPLTERSARETQKRIESILRLDHETFTNVSFFLQGRADQFAQQVPARRKEILGSILGLEDWDVFRERAAARRKGIEAELKVLDGRLGEIASELGEETQRKETCKRLEAELKQLTAVQKTQQAALEALRKTAASELAAEKARLEEERRNLEAQAEALRAGSAPLEDWIRQAAEAQEALKGIEAQIGQKEALVNARNAAREQQAELKAENEHLKPLMDELKQHIEQLKVAEGAQCPFCGQPLNEEVRRTKMQQLEKEGRQKGDQWRTNKASAEALRQQIETHEAQIKAFENLERERLALATTVTRLGGQIETNQRARLEWEKSAAPRLKQVETLLASKKFALKAQKPGGGIKEAERTLQEIQEQVIRKNQEVGAARQRVEVLEVQRRRQKELTAGREAQALSAERCRTLERAFGRDGVPALLIEQALPEIEAKANELLDRLSDGSMSVRFATQSAYKDRKREDLKETLDILISDGAGVRDYEMYSGGEAFRANFAIRLALSEVLASRKGARLQMLVIDEGFGSQDEQGRQRLIQAINAVQGDFAKVLVITHLDELKDAFPTRLEVEKDVNGSRLRVL